MVVPVLVTVTWASVSGLPEDSTTTDWAFQPPDITTPTLDALLDQVEDWWNTGNTSTLSMANYISDTMSRSADSGEMAVYDLSGALDGSPHGSPIYIRPWSPGGFSGAAGATFPAEVAIRHTINASGYATQPESAANPTPPPATIRPRARFRGGFYFGPLGRACATFAAETEPRVSGAYRGDAADAWERLLDNTPGSSFSIWSRADSAIRSVQNSGLITIDNAFDTIRKRGQASSSRVTVWPLP